jgi:uncharacterized membrane protein (UPF0127 family)
MAMAMVACSDDRTTPGDATQAVPPRAAPAQPSPPAATATATAAAKTAVQPQTPVAPATSAGTATPTAAPTPPHLTTTPTSGPIIPLGVPAVFFPKAAFPVELALTAGEIGRGLSGRDFLTPGSGMLFVFVPRVARYFWMFEMRFPLDIVWISAECAVVDVTASIPAPAPETPVSELPLYSPSSSAGYVLEINAGEAGLQGIEIGDAVRFANVSNSEGIACP